MYKTNQKQKNIFYFVKLILFIGVLLVVYRQISNFDENAWHGFKLKSSVSLLIAVILVFPNIWLAYRKWKVTLDMIGTNTDFTTLRHSFFAGLVTGMLTPNMVGNFIGRCFYFKRSLRIQITLFTLISNYAQFLASLTFGWIAILILGDLYVFGASSPFIVWLGIGVLISYLLYFFVDNFLILIRKKGYFQIFRDTLNKNRSYRIVILLLSFARFGIFTFQFSLLLHAFGESLSLENILAIWQVYLLTMLVPSLFLGKIGVRESVAIYVLTGTGIAMNEYAVLATSLIIWFINSLSPALIGLVICKSNALNE